MTLEWVSCPQCTTTFRVAVPTQYSQIDIEEDENDLDEYSASQAVPCVDETCDRVFFLGLDR